jgi:hypothetical protein
VFSTVTGKENLFPVLAQLVINAVRVIQRCFDVYSLVKQGKPGGSLIGLAKLAGDVKTTMQEVSEVCDLRPQIKESFQLVSVEFSTALASQSAKMDVAIVLDGFAKHYLPTVQAIDEWNFAGCKWMEEEKEVAADMQAAAKKLVNVVSQWPTWRNNLESVKVETVSWIGGQTAMCSMAP